MRILKLTLTNFKGVRNQVIDANGGNLSLYGMNGSGKTTHGDAIYWLLFGKDSLGRKDYEIKTVANNEVVHFLEHSVECSFRMDDGDTLTLSRTYKEDWETQRGSATKSFKGHTTTYTVNSVPQSATEYAKRINSICSEGQFRLLMDPSNFLSLDWKDRRKMLFEVCGDMTDDEVIAASPELVELGELIGNHSIEDFRKITDAQRGKTKEERTQLPARIDEATRAIPAEDKTDWAVKLKDANETLALFQESRAKIVAGGKAADIRSEIVDLLSRERSLVSELRTAPDPARDAAVKANRELDNQLSAATNKVNDLQMQVSSAARRLDNKTKEVTSLRAEAVKLKAQVYNGAHECPACNQPLPEEKVQAAVEAFNLDKAAKVDNIVVEGKALVADQNMLADQLKIMQADLATAEDSLSALKGEVKIEVPVEATIDPTTDPRYIKLSEELVTKRQELTEMLLSSESEIEKTDTAIAFAREIVNQVQRGAGDQRRRAEGLVRVKELKKREKELSATYELLEKSIFLCEQFTRAKVKLLTERINNRFELTTFRLFKEQINGGLQECCDVLWRENGALPSNGQSIQIGLDIIRTLSEHIQFFPVVVIDNAESVTSFPAMRQQFIKLIVRAEDIDLRIVNDGIADDPFVSSPSLSDLDSEAVPALF